MTFTICCKRRRAIIAHYFIPADRGMELRFESTIRLDHSHADIHDQDIEESARTYPFSYRAEEMPD